MRRMLIAAAVCAAVSAGAGLSLTAQAPDGAAIFTRDCSGCHNGAADSRAPAPTVLRQRSPEAILSALTAGGMRPQGGRLSGVERRAVAEYLAGRALGGDATGASVGRCAVNPPLDVASVLKKLDEWDALQGKFGPERSKEIQAKALGIVELFTREKRDDLAAFDVLAKGFGTFTTEELQFLIAEYLQTVLPELVTVTQAIHDQQLLTAPKGEVRKRLQEAKGTTFTEYSDNFALPVWRAQTGDVNLDSDGFSAKGSLAAILERLRGNPRVYIMHNTDDFLADPNSIKQLKEALGDRVTLYPRGGHLGNLWFPLNRAAVLRLFRR